MLASIKMAKDQGLSLDSAKISGLCDRLMCRLKYESDEYEATEKELPDYEKKVVTPDGKGKVVGLNLLSWTVKIHLHGREIVVDYDYEEIRETTAKVAAKKGDQSG